MHPHRRWSGDQLLPPHSTLVCLQDKGRAFCEAFLTRLQHLLRGTIAAQPEKWGESLADEHVSGGAALALCIDWGVLEGMQAVAAVAGSHLMTQLGLPEQRDLPQSGSSMARPRGAAAGAFTTSKAGVLAEALPNSHMRLYGGAQFHRAMSEFRCAVQGPRGPRLVAAGVTGHAAWLT